MPDARGTCTGECVLAVTWNGVHSDPLLHLGVAGHAEGCGAKRDGRIAGEVKGSQGREGKGRQNEHPFIWLLFLTCDGCE